MAGKKRYGNLVFLKRSEQTAPQKRNNGGSNYFKPTHLTMEQRENHNVPLRRRR